MPATHSSHPRIHSQALARTSAKQLNSKLPHAALHLTRAGDRLKARECAADAESDEEADEEPSLLGGGGKVLGDLQQRVRLFEKRGEGGGKAGVGGEGGEGAGGQG